VPMSRLAISASSVQSAVKLWRLGFRSPTQSFLPRISRMTRMRTQPQRPEIENLRPEAG
jgi:hypothetical protein